jgi:hypothetical protein
MAHALPGVKQLFADATSPTALAERKEALVKAATESTISGLSGETNFAGQHETGAVLIEHKADKRNMVRKALDELELAKGVDPSVMAALNTALTGGNTEMLSKEWTLSNPLSTGLVPFDLEAPAKLLTPRPTPLRNSIPRVKGQGASRRFKVISGFTGTGTGGVGTLQPGVAEGTTNVGPGGLAYIRPPYINYAGYDVTLPYVSWGLSDSVSWQAEYQGQGFEDIRSLSNTALLYSTMLMDERLMIYGRGSLTGYAGALGTPTVVATAAVASVGVTGSLTSGNTYWTVFAADAGDLLGTNGETMHEGPTTAAASVVATATGAISYSVTADVVGALGYNAFIGTAASGPFWYAGRTGYNQGYITAQATTGASVSASQADASAVATNFDGLLTNLAASGGYVKRLNTTFSTANPGVEFQTLFASLYDGVKADPDEIWLNGHDRNQLANALLSGNNVNNYRIYAPEPNLSGVRIGAVVQGINNQITGKELDFNVHPWFPQGNAMVRSVTLPIPDSNVSETSVMALPQDYVAVQWPVVQFSYDASTLEIGTMAHYAPAWSGLIQGIALNG